jgi:hypothetical protein
MTTLITPGTSPQFEPAKRMSDSDSNLYAWATVPALDEAEEMYNVELKISANDPDIELALAKYVVNAVNTVPNVLQVLKQAYSKLDSVAFLTAEGDTDLVKHELSEMIRKLSVPSSNGLRR